jgi:predicted nucleic acid-binding protein
MRWAADTGPVLHLTEAGASHLLRELGEVFVPPAVASELSAFAPAVDLPSFIHVRQLNAKAANEGEDWRRAGLIHRGEAQAIALTRQLHADILLTDDATARLFAGTLGLQARGSLGVVLWLAAKGKIPLAHAHLHLDALSRTSLWLAPNILSGAHDALHEMNRR